MAKYGFCSRCQRPFLVGDIIVQRVKKRWIGKFIGLQFFTEDIHLGCAEVKGDD